MIKIIHTGDWHLGGAYPEKAAQSSKFMIDQISNPESPAYLPDAILFGGDTTDRPLHVHSEKLAPFYDLVRATTCPIVLLQGTISHEPLGTINNIAALSDRVSVIDSPFQTIEIGPMFVMGLPGLYKPQLAKWLKEMGSEIDAFDNPAEAIREILQKLGENFAPGPMILLGHWTLSGCITPTGQKMVGADLEVGLQDLALTNADAVLLNHIHQAQEWKEPVFTTYSGPPYPTCWGELQQTSFSVLEFDEGTGKLAHFERVPFPHKPMMKIEWEFHGTQRDDGSWSCTGPGYSLADACRSEVKVCYSIPKQIAHLVDDMYVRVAFKQLGVELAAIERTIKATSRERLADIGTKETTRQQYESVCQVKSEEPRPGALEKADLIDEQGVGA